MDTCCVHCTGPYRDQNTGGGGGGGSTFLFYKHIYDYFLQQINKLNKKNLRISPAICAIFSLKFIGESFLLILFLFCFLLFSLGMMIGMVRSRTSFILSSQSWEIDSPPTGGAGRMKLSCVVPASVIHIGPIHIC